VKKIFVAGFGPGDAKNMTFACREALEAADIIVGYSKYIELILPFFPDKKFYSSPMKGEVERCRKALELAAGGATVAVACGGDAGVYGMAGLIYELYAKQEFEDIEFEDIEFEDIEIEVVPGVTAALAGAAILGAPLTHDFCVVSLSDLLTPQETIEKRLSCAAEADFCIALYNPASKKRRDGLKRACEILLKYKAPETICGIVKNAARENQSAEIISLGNLAGYDADMFTTIFIGNSQTKIIKNKIVTPRGYL
jgi:precorrin-3B C17-methyltransferase